MGNAAISQRYANRACLQAKLTIGQANDPFEQEADRVAEQVMRAAGNERSAVLQNSNLIQRKCDTCRREDEQELQLKSSPTAGLNPAPQLPGSVQQFNSGGRSLPENTRQFFESRLGYNFDAVRIHNDPLANRVSRSLNARAFTMGSHIVFGDSQYHPHSVPGQRLLAHELVHVVQQGKARPGATPDIQRLPTPAPAAPANGGLSVEMLVQIARRLRNAMAGWGTDEDAIYAALSGRTQPQVDAIARVYQDMYSRTLIGDLQDELTASEMQHLALFSPTTVSGTAAQQASGFADRVAWQLDRAMDRVGTDESAIFSALTGRTVAERQQIKDAYRRRVHRELEADLRSELSGGDLTQALQLLNQGLLQPEDELYLAMKGAGTDEATIFRVLRSLSGNVAGLRNLERNYRTKYGDLVADLRSDLSSSEYQRARAYISPTILDADVQDCVIGTGRQTTQSVREAHARAVTMLNTAIRRSATTRDPAVRAAALRYFRITLPASTPEAVRQWTHVRHALTTMARAETKATYECEPRQTLVNGFCSPNTFAVTIFNIHLCPDWWTTYADVDHRAAILIHEWGHAFGSGVATIIETYCTGSAYGRATTNQLITWPDAYMQFVWDLSIGAPAPCF